MHSTKNNQNKTVFHAVHFSEKNRNPKKSGMLSHTAFINNLTADTSYFDFLETAFGRGSSIKPFIKDTVATSKTIVNGKPVVTAIA